MVARYDASMSMAWTASSHGVEWRLELERDVLLPGRLVGGKVTITVDRALDARGLQVALRGSEHWKHNVTTTDAQGHTSTHVETERNVLVHEPVAVSGELHLGAGETRSWDVQLPVPPLGPATLEADVAGLDWAVVANLDVPGGMDPVLEGAVRVVQPVALLRSGAVTLGEFALYDSADVVGEGITGSIAMAPLPVCSGAPFTAKVTLHAGIPRKLQEIRAELRVHVKATVSDGLEEDIVAWSGSIPTTELAGDREIELSGSLADAALPSVELPHGRASATLHVILATAWSPDPHLVRDVAVATTLEL
jgi:hypothetical protein